MFYKYLKIIAKPENYKTNKPLSHAFEYLLCAKDFFSMHICKYFKIFTDALRETDENSYFTN